MTKSEIMKMAWRLKKDAKWGINSIGEAMKVAWQVARGELTLVEEAPAVELPIDPLDAVTLEMGRLARAQLTTAA